MTPLLGRDSDMLANGATCSCVNSTTATGFRSVHVHSASMLCARAAVSYTHLRAHETSAHL
eukprot:12631209-Alexandrium_andersonii.AAC.1